MKVMPARVIIIILGGAMLEGEAVADAHIKVPLKTLNRHGLIAGATGTGKTKTLQVLCRAAVTEGHSLTCHGCQG